MKRFAFIAVLYSLAYTSVGASDFAETKALADQGVAYAQYNLGIMYEHGQGVPQDYTEAVNWYRRAADQGLADADSNLGLLYYSGIGVRKDEIKAAKLWRKAAEQGHARSQYSLGMAYSSGQSAIPQDYTEAVKWYRRAANLGFAHAQYSLAYLYTIGKGVPQNYAEVYIWSNLAAASGHEDAIESRDIAASMLTPENLVVAQQRAAKLFEEIQQRKVQEYQ